MSEKTVTIVATRVFSDKEVGMRYSLEGQLLFEWKASRHTTYYCAQLEGLKSVFETVEWWYGDCDEFTQFYWAHVKLEVAKKALNVVGIGVHLQEGPVEDTRTAA
jgi:hypothetical protein